MTKPNYKVQKTTIGIEICSLGEEDEMKRQNTADPQLNGHSPREENKVKNYTNLSKFMKIEAPVSGGASNES